MYPVKVFTGGEPQGMAEEENWPPGGPKYDPSTLNDQTNLFFENWSKSNEA